MSITLDRARLAELWRYYQAAVVNTLFGLSVYFLLVWLGVNLFVAQLVSQIAGIIFNYFVYSNYVFRGSDPAILRFALAYGVNYLINLSALWVIVQFVPSPYIAGLASTLFASIVNYLLLRSFVFTKKSHD